jgi:signal transduction histidine kinase
MAAIVGLTLLFAALDVLYFLLGTQVAGGGGLALRLALDVSLLVVLRAPVLVAGLMVAGAVAMQLSVLFAPGLLVPAPTAEDTLLAPAPVGAAVFYAVLLRNRRSTWVLVAVLVLFATRPWDPSWTTIPVGLLTTAVPALAARYVEARRRLLANLRERAERTDREQRLLAEQARAEERARLAAEMHDVVTHRVSLMVLQAGAIEVTATDAGTRRAAAALRDAGMQALDELRGLVGVFGAEPTGTSPSVGPPAPRTELRDLVDASVAAGVAVRLVHTGEADAVPAAVLRTAHRVVQEALTNVHKHAPGGAVTVEVRYAADGVTVVVVNSAAGRAPDPVLAASGSGSGLRGLRERVEIIGGTLLAGARHSGGFEVRAELPVVPS